MTITPQLSIFSASVTDDGTTAFLTFSFLQGGQCKFSVSYEGAGVLAAQIDLLCKTLTQKLVESGTAQERMKDMKSSLPYNAVSARLATMQPEGSKLLSVQTNEGPFIELKFASLLAEKLFSGIDSDTPIAHDLRH